MLSAVLMVLLSGCGGGTAGVDTAITVDDVEVQVTAALTRDSYSTGQSEFSPSSRSDTLLIVSADVTNATDDFDAADWDVIAEDEAGRTADPDLRISRTGTFEGAERHSLTWVFAVTRTSQQFTLSIEGQEVDLTALLTDDGE